jgi:5-hydroxyisourate hydrolase-like protein (transthyretin family)
MTRTLGWAGHVVAALLGAAALMGVAGAPAAAQVLDGLALGPDGQPLPGVPVALHRVGGMGGSSVASATTDEEGRFQFEIQVADSAIYFAATRYEGKMYIGPAAQAGADPITNYVLRVEPSAEAGNMASSLSGMTPPTPVARPASATAGESAPWVPWIVLVLALAAAATFLVTAPRSRLRRTRESMVQLARLENRLADPDFDGDRDAVVARRDALRERLAPRP